MDLTPLLIDACEAARLLNTSKARVTRLAKRGQIPCVELPDGEIRFLPEDLQDWVKSRRQPVEGQAANARDTDQTEAGDLVELLPMVDIALAIAAGGAR